MARLITRGQQFLQVSAAPVTGYPFTLAGWLRVSVLNPGGNQNLLNSTAGNTSQNTFGIGENTSGLITGFVSNVAGTFSTITVGSAISINTWYPVVYVAVSSTNRTLYVFQSGALASTNDVTSILLSGTTNQTQIGAFGTPSTADYGGPAAECAIWNVALSVLEVTAFCLGARAYTIRSGSLKGYWPLDGLASPEPDLSGSKNNMANTGTGSASVLAFGPPFAPFTPRWPIYAPFRIPPAAAASPFLAARAMRANQVYTGYATQ